MLRKHALDQEKSMIRKKRKRTRVRPRKKKRNKLPTKKRSKKTRSRPSYHPRKKKVLRSFFFYKLPPQVAAFWQACKQTCKVIGRHI